MLLSRRGLITGLASLVAAPAIVRASSLMPVKAWAPEVLTDFDLFKYGPALWDSAEGALYSYDTRRGLWLKAPRS
jgi:hypothetical protein